MAQAEEILDAEAEEAPVKKSKKKLFALLGAALLVLGGGGAGAWYFLGHQDEAHAAEAEAEPPAAPVFVRLESFTVNLQPADEERYLQVEIVLRVPNDEQSEIFKQHMPEVRNRLLILLSSKHAEELIPAEGKEKLMQEIVSAMKKPFTAKAKTQEVGGVFFTSFIIQ